MKMTIPMGCLCKAANKEELAMWGTNKQKETVY